MAFLHDARRLLDAGVGWAGLPVDALGAVLADVAQTGRWLVVVDGADVSERLTEALRFFFDSSSAIYRFPADDNRPYDGFSPHPDLPVARTLALHAADGDGPMVIVAAAEALLARVPDASTRRRSVLTVAAGFAASRDGMVASLLASGYLGTGQVDEPGSFSVRGDVLDVWPVAAAHPIRIDFFDDEVEDVRRLDPETRRARNRLSRATILPAREELLDAAARERLAGELGRLVAAQGRGVAQRRRLIEDLGAGVRFAGVEAYLPALVPTQTPLEAFSDFRTIAVHPEEVRTALREFCRSARERWRSVPEERRPLVPPEERYADPEAVFSSLAPAHRVDAVAVEGRSVDLGARPVEGLAVRGGDLEPVVARLRGLAERDVQVGIVVHSARQLEPVREMLGNHGIRCSIWPSIRDGVAGRVGLVPGRLRQGFVAEASGVAWIPSSSIFGQQRSSTRMEQTHAFFDAAVGSLSELREGDHVVHRQHGIGLYRGLKRIRIGEAPQDFVQIEYRDGDLLLLPVTRLDTLSRYVAAHGDTMVRLDKLGGATWNARRAKVRDAVLKMAEELLGIYARRELATREPYLPVGEAYRMFEARFPYEETPDQAAAIDAVNADLDLDVPMDRLLCGDVGFGKTEVAMRAAMRAVESGRQVAVLCPTTVLAFQHLQRFRERFQGLPVTVEMLSRFRSPAEEREVLTKMREGRVDIVIGTTRLLGRELRFANLGLIVVDEEHRFGVRQKERLKKMRSEVDVLSMSATPIPRTLQMGLSGVRAMSVMASPPRDRLSVRTQIIERDATRIRDAVLHELGRGGQVFFVHNRVADIGEVAAEFAGWVPEARVGVAHGQMDTEVLEQVLIDFIEHRTDVLISSAIIESGIDIPNVNTMIIDRADQFGLAQLYQLRGRVGRGASRAHCILMLPESPTDDARRRVQALVDHSETGSGFRIAMADLEMRGAGNLLGDAQSGNIDSVGYETWLEILEEAVQSARGSLDRKRIDPEVEVPIPAFLPDALLPDVPERLAAYRRLSSAARESEVDAWRADLSERFGELPSEVENLAGLAVVRLLCRELGIVRCHWLKVRVSLDFHAASPVDDARLTRLVTGAPKRFQRREGVDGRGLDVRFLPQEAEQPLLFLRWLLAQVARSGSSAS